MNNDLTRVLQATAKVQKSSERCKSGRRTEQERSGALADNNMIADCAVMIAKRKPPERSG